MLGLLPSTALAALAIAVASPVSASAAPPRGELLDATRVVSLSRAQVAERVQAYGFPADRVRSGVVAYRVGYATIDVAAAPTTATGLVVLPRNGAQRLRTVSYTHGTMARRSDAPSRSLDSLAGASVLLFAGAGYATVAPDYLGLGDGPGAHPFMHLASETSASLDLLPAARALAQRDARELDRRVLVTGFSQGAVAALGLARQLQEGQELAALAPMSGPYAIERAQIPATLAGRLDERTANYYLSYGMLAWQPLFGVFDAPGDVWRGHWGPRLRRLFDGTHDDVEILKVVPEHLAQLFTPAFRARLAHPDGGLLAAMRQNDAACAWAPQVPTRLYGARGDDQVAFANSRRCLADLRAHGADADLRDLGRTDHFGSTVAATPQVLAFFDALSGVAVSSADVSTPPRPAAIFAAIDGDGEVRVAAGDRRHHRRVGHVEALDPVHLAVGSDDRADAARPGGMAVVDDPGADVEVGGRDARARQRREALVGGHPLEQVARLGQHLQVVAVRVAQVAVVDQRQRARVGVAQRDAALRAGAHRAAVHRDRRQAGMARCSRRRRGRRGCRTARRRSSEDRARPTVCSSGW